MSKHGGAKEEPVLNARWREAWEASPHMVTRTRMRNIEDY